MRTVAIVQARMRSTRLPGKVLLPILGRPMLELLVERLRRVPDIDDVVVATTDDPSCDPIVALGARVGIGCYRGSESDVLDRVLRAARWAKADLIVEITADCPLIDPPTIQRVIEAFDRGGVDYCSNVIRRTYPRGLDVQVFPLSVLEAVARLTDDPVDHEHVSLYIYQHPERFRLRNVESGLAPEIADLRLTVDTPEDFELVRAIYTRLSPANSSFVLDDILALLEREPGLAALNRHIQQKAVR